MRLVAWDALPEEMRNEWVRPYYEALVKKRAQLVGKRCFDVALSTILLVLLSPAFLVLAIAIKLDSPGPVFYRQERVTQYGKRFRIFKFRTMCDRADQMGSAVTTGGDARVTRVGAKIRDYRLDEISQLIDSFAGDYDVCGYTSGGAPLCGGLHIRDDGDAAVTCGCHFHGEHPVQG